MEGTRTVSSEHSGPAQGPFAFALTGMTVVDLLFVLGLPIACLTLNPGIFELGALGILSAQWGRYPAYILTVLLFLAFWPAATSAADDRVRGAQVGAVFLGLVLSGALAAVLIPYAVLNMADGLAALNMLLRSGPLTGAPADTPLAVQAALPLLGLATSVTVGRYFKRYRALRRGIDDFVAARPFMLAGAAGPLALTVLMSAAVDALIAAVA